jgi:hypothetical protein
LGQPARIGSWGLTVDDLANPNEYVVIRYRSEGRRHSEDFEIVRHLSCAALSEERASDLARLTGMPEGVARQLIWQVAMKLATDRATEAETGYRPVR